MSKYEVNFLYGTIEAILVYVEANHNVSRKDIIKAIKNNDGFYQGWKNVWNYGFLHKRKREAEEKEAV